MEIITEDFVLPLWRDQTLDVIDLFVDPAADIQTTFMGGKGPQALKQHARETFNAFSAFQLTIEDVMQRKHQLIYKWHIDTIHSGTVLNIPPSGQTIHFSEIVVCDIEEGMITKYQSFTNIPPVLKSVMSTLDPDFLNGVDRDTISLISVVRNITGKRLTAREIECLSFWLKGFSIKQTAKALGGLSSRTVQTFRENIKRKLSVENFQQLFSLIQQCGIMPLFLTENDFQGQNSDFFEVPTVLLGNLIEY